MKASIQANPILSLLVDQYARLKAQQAELNDELQYIKDKLVEAGVSPIEGETHRATVSLTAGRTTIDWKAIAEKFNPSRQLITAHTSKGQDFYTLRISARKGVKK
jgi:N-acetylglutamate synthase/N-acetylornithine aminotransferase